MYSTSKPNICAAARTARVAVVWHKRCLKFIGNSKKVVETSPRRPMCSWNSANKHSITSIQERYFLFAPSSLACRSIDKFLRGLLHGQDWLSFIHLWISFNAASLEEKRASTTELSCTSGLTIGSIQVKIYAYAIKLSRDSRHVQLNAVNHFHYFVPKRSVS